MKRAPHREAGFTLIELMMAVAMVGILASVAIPSYTRYIQRARDTEATTLLRRIADGAVAYMDGHNGQTPATFCSSTCSAHAWSSNISDLNSCKNHGGVYTRTQTYYLRKDTISYAKVWKAIGFDHSDPLRFRYYYHAHTHPTNKNYIWSDINAYRYYSCKPPIKRVHYRLLGQIHQGVVRYTGPIVTTYDY